MLTTQRGRWYKIGWPLRTILWLWHEFRAAAARSREMSPAAHRSGGADQEDSDWPGHFGSQRLVGDGWIVCRHHYQLR
jgi:hypothetical protein